MQIKINLKIFIFLIIFLITNQIKIYAYLMLFAFIHELGHLYMGLLLGLKPKSLKIMPFGVSILFETYKTKKQTQTKKMFIAIAGPVVNIIIAIVGWLFEWQVEIIYANILIAIFNLLPIYPLDGGRIINAILSMKLKQERVIKYILKISNISIIILTIIASIGILYLKNIAIIFIIAYLWWLVIRLNKISKMKKKMYDTINAVKVPKGAKRDGEFWHMFAKK